MLINVFYIFVTYLIGSLSSAIIVCRLWGLPDPRSKGSKNPGATNVLRIGGKIPAFLTLIGDGLKGFLPTLLAVQLELSYWVIGSIMLAALLGHILPVFFDFKGGKGVATGMGAFLGLDWLLGAILITVWALLIIITRISSLGAIVAVSIAPIVAWLLLQDLTLSSFILVMTVVLLVRHKENILRLYHGKESKI